MKSTLPDTWFSHEDLERIWRISHGELPFSLLSKEEEKEFIRVINYIGMHKIAGKEWLTSTLQ